MKSSDMFYQTPAFVILHAMEERGITQADLARDLGVSRDKVSRALTNGGLSLRCANPTPKKYTRLILNHLGLVW